MKEKKEEGGEDIRTDQSKVVQKVLADLKTEDRYNLFKEVEELWRVHCNPDRDPKNDDPSNLQ